MQKLLVKKILVDWNRTEATFPDNKTYHELFEDQVRKTPENIALYFNDETLTYRELNEKINHLTYALRGHFLKHKNNESCGDEPVGLCVERGIEMIIGILAIFKAGCAYVPMDPTYPEERLRYMAENSRMKVVLSRKDVLDKFSFLSEDKIEIICLDSDWDEIEKFPETDPEKNIKSDNLAYIIYTSGSTGKPKGIMIEHRNLVNFAIDHRRRLKISGKSRVLQYISMSFDASFVEIGPTLISGGALYIISKDDRVDPNKLFAFLKEKNITHATFPAALFELLPKKEGLSIETFVVGGDVCSGDTLKFWSSNSLVINAYGPSEATVCTTACVYDETKLPNQIGKGIQNVKLYVLDKEIKPVAIDIPGELYIGGAAVGRGYLHRDDLTEKSFIKSPFVPEERLYKTGDLVKWTSQGDILFLGRVDFQVKIRGFRVEPEEIENVLTSYPDVKQSIVNPWEGKGEKQLVAYYIEKEDISISRQELRSFLESKLSDYMVPAYFVKLDKFPLTPNGKVDRKALPAPKLSDVLSREEYVAPKTEEEKKLAGIWCEVLKIEKVGFKDNFFTIGGHSLSATLVVSRIQEEFNISCSVSAIFEHPVLGELAEVIGKKPSKADGIAQKIEIVNREERLPLSFAQQRLWFLDQYEHEQNIAYNIPMAFRFKDPIDIKAVEHGINAMIERHEVLRTVFKSEDGEPYQVILPPYQVKLTAEPVEEKDLDKLLSEETLKLFELDKGPLMKIRMFKLENNEHVMIVNQHHIISDGWAAWVFLNELKELYIAYIEDRPSGLNPLKVQYADFACWQKQRLSGEFLESQISYWKGKLQGFEELNLTPDRPRPAVKTFNGKHYHFTIDKKITSSLKDLTKGGGASLFMVLLSAFNILLKCYSDQDDIILGSPIANRNNRDIEDMIGFFVNTMVLRNDLSGNVSFSELLERVKKTCLDAYSYQDLPFEYLVDSLKIKRDASRSAIFDVMFVLQNAGDELCLNLPGINSEVVNFGYNTSKFDILLSLTETENGLTGEFEYNTDLYNGTTIKRMSGHFSRLLESIIENPEEKIEYLQIITSEEEEQIKNWNSTDAFFPEDVTLHELFLEEVRKNPSRTAVIVENKSLSYKDLNKRANCLANHLINDYSVKKDTFVGLCMERSFEMIISMVAIMKAGGAYVPIDPDYPLERMKYIMKDGELDVIVSQSHLISSLPFLKENRTNVISLDTQWDKINKASDREPIIECDPSDLAYIIYTSGSTGKPKGVMVEHRGVVNRILWMQKEYNLTSKDRILQKTPFSFDVSVWEFIWPILTGSTLCFAKPGGHKDPDYLIKTIQDYGITTIHFVPSMFKVFLDTLRSSGEKVDSIKRIICSGEALSNQLAVQCRELIPWATLQNLYGPTEASIDVTYWDCNSTEHRENAGVPIGMPIDNTQLYILDKHLNLLPTGVPGELYLGGAGLARGYVNLPSVTKERFIDNPFYKKGDKAYNSRLYKTGDLVRYLPDGAVDYIGRTDFQVKVRGFRIELGEIESVLNEYVGVNQNVVVVREDEGEKIIVAYYVLTESGSDEIPVDSLRSFLGKRLTEYMVPSIFVHMEELPLTQSGKVNRRALPPPTRKDRVTEGEFVPPKTSEECVLANIWQDILHLDKIGIYDNFFSMGGHSLSATRVASQVSQFYDISCPVKVLFECPTILSLSTYVSEQLSYGPLQSHSIELADRNEILPLSFAQQRLWFLHQYEEGQASTYNIPLAYRIKGGLNIPLLEQSFNILINRHESFRTVFKTKAGIASQEILPPFNLKITIEDISEDKLASIITEEANHTFDLTKGPILRVRLLKLKDKDHVLLINQHHIISDGWSVEILLNELEEIYSAYSSKTQPALEDLKFQYADFASWQKKWLHGEILEDQVKYWRNKLEDFISLDLPSDKIRPAIRSTEGKHYYFKLDKLGASITDLAKETGTTNFMVLLAAFNVLLKCYSGKEDIISGSPIANRNHRGLENIIGFFVNTLVLRNDLSGNPDFIEVIGRVKETCLEAYGHQDLPFDQLIDELNVEREPSHNPIFDVMFVVENKGLKLNLPDVEIADLTVGYDISKFDLTFTVKEEDDELSGNIEYSTSLYNEETIERMAEHFNTLLKSLLNNPKGSINKLSVLTQKEKELILTEWNQTETPYPHDKTIHQLFEEQAEKNPDKIAVIFEEEKLTYKELNEKANKVAHAIRGQYKWMYEEDIKPDTLIGLCMNRSINLIIGTLGILKAGCAYLPLDPTYPDKRLNFMMEDACAPIMLVSKEIIERLLFLNDVEYGVISLDSGWEAIEPKSSENPVNINKPGDLAYVIYTSGSTGKPKGVMIEHKSVNRLVRDTNFISISPEDRVSNAANISFDAATLEIWSGLLNGATVISVSQDVLLNVDLFTEFIEREKINVLFLTASLFHYYGTNKPSIYSKLKYLMSGGDTLNPDIIYKILRCPQGAPEYIINCYGPTENATITTTFHVAEALSKGRSIPIGKSIANTTSYILDNGLNPLPVGVPGALYTGGEGLSRGYLHRPVITAERFIDNPFATPSEIERGRNTVIYNTGDLARWLPDGNIEFLGRSDNQIKIRGFRIELEEIEALLGSHTSVSQCVVIVRTAGDQKQIIAYYVPEEKDPVTKKVLRAFLENELPDYMIPSVFMEMRSLPMTSHQKVDRKALPSPDESDFASGTKFVAPETENEKALAEIWKSILRLERVGKNDNFFSIGGDSIMSIQVISRARDAGLYLTPKQLFSHPTIAELALEASEIKESVISASQDLMKGHSPLTPVQLWFFEKNFSVKEHFNQAFLLRFNRKIDVSILKKTMETLLKHHDALRLRYHKDKEGNWKQSFSESLEVSIKVMDISKEDNQSDFIESKCSDLQAALKLYGPVIQAGVFKGHSDGSDRLLLAVHHLIVDMVSWRIILEDFQNVYTTLADGKEFSMPAKTSSFRDWANGLKAYEGEKEMGSQLNYWQNIEKDAKPFYVELEKELHSGKEESEISVSLEKSLTLSLLQDVPQAYHTQVNDILLSALVLAYYEWTGESELFLDLEGHGREECIKNVDISRTVGWFTSVFPVRLSLPLHSGEVIDDMLISSTIKAIKEQLATIPDKGVGYGVLRYLRPETSDLCGTRGIGFNYLGKLDSADTELFGFADELSGPSTAPENKSLHLIDANGYIADDVFKMSFTYSNKNYKTETIEKFGTAFKNKLKKIINHCLKSETGGYTPSDFPLANVTQSFLDKLDQKKIETIYMASPLQKGLLFHALYEPGSDQYCTQLYWTYDGDLDRNILKKSWNTLIDRYGIFRTAFGWEGIKEAVQVVYKDVEVSWHEEDWRKFSNKERKQKLKEYVTEDRKRGFNFSEPCIMRFHILRFEKNKFEFIWTHHHTLLDGWCLSIIINELRQIYESLVKKEKIVLSKRPLYKNYIAWLMEQNKVETFDFWKKYLVDFDAPTDLSVNHKKLNIHKPIENLKRSYLYFYPSLTRTSQEFVKKHQTTFNALVKQSWATVLAHYSGNENIVIGSTVSGRPAELPGVESMIGLFINTLPFRIGTGKEKSAIERVKELHRIIQDANHYSTVTMKEIQGLTQVPAGLPMFYSLYVFENYPLDEGSMDIEGISMKDVQSFEKTNFPLTLVAAPGEKLELMVLYDSDCFEKNVIERLLKHIQNVVEWIIENPEMPLTEAKILSENEQEKILIDWNKTELTFPDKKTVPELFEENVRKNPDNIALIFNEEKLTYKELNNRANKLAQHLRNHISEKGKTGGDVLIGLCSERSTDSIVAMLAILKAGGAYVPMDVEYPEERIRFMLSDTGMQTVVAQKKMLKALPFLAEDGREVILIDDTEELSEISGENLTSNITPESLAYIIYTSGSTGTPKGVMIEQRSIMRLTQNQEYLSIYENDCVAHSANISFDAATFEVWAPLLNGAKISILSKETLLTPKLLKEKLSSDKVTIQFFTTALFHLLIDEYPDTLKGHRVVLFGGEESNAEIIGKFLADKRDELQVLHVYGPTETTTFATYCELTKHHKGMRVMPIGKGLSGKSLYVLDPYLNPVPVGISGELYIGGDGVAKGYLKREKLSSERFIKNTFSEGFEVGVNDRLYKTGDLVLWQSDGNLEFIGRTDFQVKIRGFRIELGEIETKLARHPGIGSCLVLVLKIKDEKQIVAYYTGENISHNDFSVYLEKELPPYMIPDYFIKLEAFPLTPNGKIDRKKLPVPTGEEYAGAEFIPPHTVEEKAIARIWCEVLELEKVSVNDNFFTLGGHSLTATQVVSRIQQAFDITIAIKSIFDYPDIARLSSFVFHELTDNKLHQQPIEPVDSTDALPLSYAQERLWFLDQYEGGSSNTYNIPAIINLEGKLDIPALEKSFNIFIENHKSLRTVFKSKDGVPYQQILPSLKITIDKRKAKKEDMKEILTAEGIKSFDLSTGPLIRVVLFETGATCATGAICATGKEEYVLLINQHHIICDGWSMGILFRELKLIYASIVTDTILALPKNNVDYPDYAAWQRKWLGGEYLEGELEYWKGKLENYANLDLPTDHPRPIKQTYNGSRYIYRMDMELLNSLNNLAKETSTTLFMVLLSAFNVILNRYSGQDDIIVGSPIANRNHKDIEGMYGFFVNTLVLRSDLSGNKSFLDLLEQVKETCLEAYSHQDVQFEHLVDLLGVKRDMSRQPIFNVMFALQNATNSLGLELYGVKSEDGGVEYDISKFDLTMNLVELNNGLGCEIEYNTDLYNDETIVRMAGHFKTVLEGIAHNSNQKISILPILTEDEQNSLIFDWNNHEVPFIENKTFYQVFEERVDKSPDNIAVFYEGEQLTYCELNERANQLARYIRNKFSSSPEGALAKDDFIGLCIERSLNMIVGILAILKSGSIYVPLDPDYPKERLRFMLEDTKARAILSQKRIIEKTPVLEEFNGILISLDEEQSEIQKETTDNLGAVNMETDLAYVIYTSGSTGKPKGVMLEHKGAVNLAEETIKCMRIEDDSNVLQYASINFDASIADMFPALMKGAALYVIPESKRKSPEEVYQYLECNEINIATIPPAMVSLFPHKNIESLKTFVVAGETCDKDVMDFWSEGRHFVNAYGPTECTVCASACVYDKTKLATQIGRPNQNTKLYVLDKELQLLPVGVPGEMYIAGVGVARGYLNRPDLTEERFIENPFVSDKNRDEGQYTRMYKTGDLVRRLENGDIDYIGRTDFQVKIRGFRIELGEIEALLAKHEKISQVIVVAREFAGSKQMMAYYVTNEEENLQVTSAELRDYIEEILPDYMIPSFFIKMDSFPLTSNGKIDRKLLPGPDELTLVDKKRFIDARDPVEFKLQKLWEKLLGISRISIDESFFTVGGHSLLTIRLTSKIKELFSITYPVSWVFFHDTIGKQAKAIRGQEDVSLQYNPMMSFNENGRKTPIFFVHPGGGGAATYCEFADLLDKDQPFYSIESYNMYSDKPFLETIEELAEKYISYIEELNLSGPCVLGGWSLGGLIAYEMAHILTKRNKEISNVYLLDTFLPDHENRDLLLELNSREFIEGMFDQNELYSEVPDDFKERLISVHKLENEAVNKYIPQKYNGKVLLFKANVKGDLPNGISEKSVNIFSKISEKDLTSNDKGWGAYVENMDIKVIEGNHESLVTGDDLKEIVDIIMEET